MSATNRVMPAIGSVQALPDHKLRVTWLRGSRVGRVDVVDVSPMIFSYKVYKPLRSDKKLWERGQLAMFGNSVSWNDELDMSADAIEYLAQETFSKEDFKGFMDRCGLTQEAAARAIGRSRRQVAAYLAGEDMPRVVVLACIAYEARHTVPRADPAPQLVVSAGVTTKERSVYVFAPKFPTGATSDTNHIERVV